MGAIYQENEEAGITKTKQVLDAPGGSFRLDSALVIRHSSFVS
jgi:hypothetical protein